MRVPQIGGGESLNLQAIVRVAISLKGYWTNGIRAKLSAFRRWLGGIGTTTMAFAFLKVEDDGKLEDDEIRLGEPIDAETTNLLLHVNRCAARYSVTVRRLNRLDRKVDKLLFLAIAILLASLFPSAWSIVSKL